MAEAQATTSDARLSRVGKRPIPLPKGVTVNVSGRTVDLQGPKGKLKKALPDGVEVKKDGDTLHVSSNASGSNAPRLQGLGRALLAAMVKGVADGYERTLELVGTGYRAEIKDNRVHLQVGLSHPSSFELPPGVSASIPKDSKGTLLVLSSADKAVLGQAAATIRSIRPPEPYGGKGIRYRGEQVRRKAGKAGKARK